MINLYFFVLNNFSGFRSKNMFDLGIQDDDNIFEFFVQNFKDYLVRFGIEFVYIQIKIQNIM